MLARTHKALTGLAFDLSAAAGHGLPRAARKAVVDGSADRLAWVAQIVSLRHRRFDMRQPRRRLFFVKLMKLDERTSRPRHKKSVLACTR